MELSNVDLLKLQSQMMQRDETVQGMSAALSEQFRAIAKAVEAVLLYANTDSLPESALDILAWQFGADWYDSTSDLYTKRQAIRDALYLARTRGTPAAVQRIVDIYFGGGEVQEWFDYGGEPYHFRVVTGDETATSRNAALFQRAVGSVKNLRSVLDAVIIQTRDTVNFHAGVALHIGDYMTIRMVE
ncbi:phage tail protein I [Gorillibacterium sp. CAU 1737]|uniref:phage tail protein I n=1 Tax=Gorillibacterium sp. CAU 1737 TaxID=3140362 RepID=UPI00326088DF